MLTKAEQTRQHIIETVAPIFNRYGYAATSMADITKAVGMTKGAIYGNFENKEALAIAAFNHNIRRVARGIQRRMDEGRTPLERLEAMLDYFAVYHECLKETGGCPVVNMGVDANPQNEQMLARVQTVIQKLQNSIAHELQASIDAGELDPVLPVKAAAQHLYTSIQGAVFMTMTMRDNNYMTQTIHFLRDYLRQYQLLE